MWNAPNPHLRKPGYGLKLLFNGFTSVSNRSSSYDRAPEIPLRRLLHAHLEVLIILNQGRIIAPMLLLITLV